jgi:hypothetical protein
MFGMVPLWCSGSNVPIEKQVKRFRSTMERNVTPTDPMLGIFRKIAQKKMLKNMVLGTRWNKSSWGAPCDIGASPSRVIRLKANAKWA